MQAKDRSTMRIRARGTAQALAHFNARWAFLVTPAPRAQAASGSTTCNERTGAVAPNPPGRSGPLRQGPATDQAIPVPAPETDDAHALAVM